ncbi:hypothetical protein THOM_3227 [Trachipleistophora hominis]|uniref:t-SNARE coiled-coil homology domain-containing protein n=1 Tax=Trachipleistophora hominis TaxID=72359 RepID=L7JSY1_TRAHO|nr:hypothetical protein THOM_3227 [Trachipleistophora hominis]
MPRFSAQSLETYNTHLKSSLEALKQNYAPSYHQETKDLITACIDLINTTKQRPRHVEEFNMLYNSYKSYVKSRNNINTMIERAASNRNDKMYRINDGIGEVVKLTGLVDELVHGQREFVDNVEIMMDMNRDTMRRSNDEMKVTMRRRKESKMWKQVFGIMLVFCVLYCIFKIFH